MKCILDWSGADSPGWCGWMAVKRVHCCCCCRSWSRHCPARRCPASCHSAVTTGFSRMISLRIGAKDWSSLLTSKLLKSSSVFCLLSAVFVYFCSAGLLQMEVRTHNATAHGTALVVCTWAHSVQTCGACFPLSNGRRRLTSSHAYVAANWPGHYNWRCQSNVNQTVS